MNDLVVVQKIAGWKLKALVLDKRLLADYKTRLQYGAGRVPLWFQQAPRPGFTKATVSAWRVSLEARGREARRRSSFGCLRFASWQPRRRLADCSRPN